MVPEHIPPPAPGTVYLVGAGPGDPKLLTLAGMEALQRADVVLYDYLVNPVLVAHAPTAAECICLGKHGTTRIWSQDEINARMLSEAQAGRCVVRLKSGDPSIFGRLLSETTTLIEHDIPFVIVPGITAASAAGAYAGVHVTHREHASAVAFVTGHEARSKKGKPLDFRGLARFPGTLVIYMGVTTSPRWTAELIEGGLPPETPVALIRKCSLPDQRTITCTLEQVPQELTPYSRFPPPVIAIVGKVSSDTQGRDWFASRPLFGNTVLIARPREQCDTLDAMLSTAGARTLIQPAIEVKPPDAWDKVDEAIDRLTDFQWIVFSSANGVRFFCRRLEARGGDARAFATCRLAAIGPGTARALSEFGLRADLIPDEARAESLAAALMDQTIVGQACLLIRASRGRDVLPRMLQEAGATTTEVVGYRSDDVQEVDPLVQRAIEQGQVDWVAVTSSAIGRSLHALFGKQLDRCQLVSISPITTETLAQLGHTVAVEATEHTMPGLVQALIASTGESQAQREP